MRDRNLNASVSAEVSSSGSYQENDKDHFTLPWVKGGTNKDKVSKERAALRKAYSQKDCAT